jgi:Short C-terminal domain
MRTPPGFVGPLIRCLLLLSIGVLVLSIGGFVISQVRNAVSVPRFDSNVSSDYRAYGEVPIPGTQTLHLPAGKVAISFHAVTVGIPEAGLPVPDLKLDIDPPAGVADPQVTESIGGTTSFNNDAWRQVWVAQIPQEGDYQITTDGKVTAFVSAQLAFGHADVSPPSAPGPLNPSGGLASISRIAFIAALLTLIGCVWAGRMLGGRAHHFEPAADIPVGSANSVLSEDLSEDVVPAAAPAQMTAPTPQAQSIAGRLQELETLRASGAISDAEYTAKRQQIIADI